MRDEDEVLDELTHHFQHLGHSEGEARALARAQLKQLGVRTRPSPSSLHPLGGWWQDVRYGFRSLRRSPGFTVVAVLSLGLAIGANTAIFGLLNVVLLQRLALPRAEQLVMIGQTTSQGPIDRLLFTQYVALKSAPGLPAMEAMSFASGTVVARNGRDYPGVELVTGRYQTFIGLRPILGRLISRDDEESRAPVTVIGERYWRERFAADPRAIGETITLNGQRFTIVGVVPSSYHGLMFGNSFTLAVPLTLSSVVGLPNFAGEPRASLWVVSHIDEGQARERTRQSLETVYQRCCANVPLPGRRGRPVLSSPTDKAATTPHVLLIDASRGFSNPKRDMRDEYRRILFVLMAGVAIVLLIACANVGTLLLARATARQRELALRMSIGATRWRLVRQLLTESLELALAGGVIGLLLARAGTSLLSHNLPQIATNLSDLVVLRPSPIILGFTAAVTLGCTVLFGVLPAIRATRADLVTPLKESPRGGGRRWAVDRALVVAQVALALVLVCAAGLFVTTLNNLRRFDGGYRSTNVLLATLETRETSYDERSLAALVPDVLARIQQLPGVQHAALSPTAPVYGGRVSMNLITVPGYDPTPDEDRLTARMNAITPGYFAATSIGLERGRPFDERDRATSEHVAIVSQSFVRHFFRDRDPIGAMVRFGGDSALGVRIVGVARDARYDDLREPAPEMIYVPLSQNGGWPFLVLIARTNNDPTNLMPMAMRAIEGIAPGIRVNRPTSVEPVLNEALARERLAAALATVFGAMALCLAAIGLYGVVAYNVARRTHEIGVRMALGADASDAVWIVARQMLVMTALGVVLGLPLAIGAGRGIASQLYDIDAGDPRVMAGAAILLLLAAAAASVLPSWRAARVDPIEALRAE